MVRHIVMFKLGGDNAEKAALSFKSALEALPAQIPCLRSMEVGINQNLAEKWTLVLTATLDSMADVDVYAKHPAHVAAAALISDCKIDRACVDFEI